MKMLGMLIFYALCTFMQLPDVIAISSTPDKLTLHIITHSHLDAGWVYDVDKCYDVVKTIFSGVFQELLKNRSRTYTVGDLYFFERWYK
jgi:hypothetical protein